MKVGILTLPFHTNYGGILQAFALQTFLERMGHSVVVYNKDRTPEKVSKYRILSSNFLDFCHCLKHGKSFKYVDVNETLKNKYELFLIKTQNTQLFVDKYLHVYPVKNYRQGIPNSKIDAVVVGSDQIWGCKVGKAIDGSVTNSFLPYLDKSILRMSYAASFGYDVWKYDKKQTSVVKEAIKQFVGVSVRETSGVELCDKYLGVRSEHHVDPTMLLTKDDYINIIDLQSVTHSPGNLLVYLLDSTAEKESIVEYVAHKLSLDAFKVNSKAEDTNIKNAAMSEIIQPPVEKWLRGFMDAEFVVTDSFHACVFSLLFHKPFVVIGNKKRGMARFISLLSQFGLADRLVNDINDIKNIDLESSLDGESIETIFKKERLRSMEYLGKLK